MKDRAALLIATYNDPVFLGISLQALTNQSDQNFDIFVADDGSSDETQKKVALFQPIFQKLGVRLQHFWQPDDGFRKAKINNEVFRQAKDYPVIICIDGDTFSHYRFIEDHMRLHRGHKRLLVMGRRVDLGPEITQEISEKNVCQLNRGLSLPLTLSGLRGDTPNAFRALRVGSPFLQRLFKRDQVFDLIGSNYSISSQVMFDVNGYNEDFKSYWGEDGELFIRIRNHKDVKRIGIKSYAIQYHMYHKRREANQQSIEEYHSLLNDHSYMRCKNGIVKD